MTNENLIVGLKKNTKPFGLMSTQMQAKAKEIGIRNISLYTYNIDGGYQFLHWCSRQHGGFKTDVVYQLPDHYTEEPEIVEEVVMERNNVLSFSHHPFGIVQLSEASSHPDFIGFEVDGMLYGRLYKHKELGCHCMFIRKDELDQFEVCDMAEAKVLFKGPKT